VTNPSRTDLASASSGRRAYVKPSVKRVPLRPDEAVLGGCKTSSQAGPLSGSCTSPAACSSTTVS
jgi:hypothetical protein